MGFGGVVDLFLGCVELIDGQVYLAFGVGWLYIR